MAPVYSRYGGCVLPLSLDVQLRWRIVALKKSQKCETRRNGTRQGPRTYRCGDSSRRTPSCTSEQGCDIVGPSPSYRHAMGAAVVTEITENSEERMKEDFHTFDIHGCFREAASTVAGSLLKTRPSQLRLEQVPQNQQRNGPEITLARRCLDGLRVKLAPPATVVPTGISRLSHFFSKWTKPPRGAGRDCAPLRPFAGPLEIDASRSLT